MSLSSIRKPEKKHIYLLIAIYRWSVIKYLPVDFVEPTVNRIVGRCFKYKQSGHIIFQLLAAMEYQSLNFQQTVQL